MPQLALLALAGAGLYAGLKWIARSVLAQAEAARREAHEQAGRAAAAHTSVRQARRDSVELEWDSKDEVYRPKG